MTAELADKCHAWAKELRVVAKGLSRAAGNQHDCCHGDGASEELEDAARTVDRIAQKIEEYDILELRMSLRST